MIDVGVGGDRSQTREEVCFEDIENKLVAVQAIQVGNKNTKAS